MKKIVHLSDLHFGKIDIQTLQPLRATIMSARPNLVVISGDLTQRARVQEYRQARDFLQSLPYPLLIVPGNHDIPVYNLLARVLWPRFRYRQHINQELQPVYFDDEMVVVGLNTTRVSQIKNGRITLPQIEYVHNLLRTMPESVIRIVVTHHPFSIPDHAPISVISPVLGARKTIEKLEQAKPDIFLSGHLHVSGVMRTADTFQIKKHSSLLVMAGTATSLRRRHEANTFNILSVGQNTVKIERFAWHMNAMGFLCNSTQKFSRSTAGWKVSPDLT